MRGWSAIWVFFIACSFDTSGSTVTDATLVADADPLVPDADPTAPDACSAGCPDIELVESFSAGSETSSTVSVPVISSSSAGLHLAAISTVLDTTVVAVDGSGLTWTEVRSQCSGRLAPEPVTGMSVWAAYGSATEGTVTATFDEEEDVAAMVVARYSGSAASVAAATGSVASSNTVGGGSCSGGTDSDVYSLQIAPLAANSAVFVAVADRNRSHTAGSGFSEHDQIHHGSDGRVAGIHIADKLVAGADEVDITGTFGGDVDWAVVAIELRR